VAKSRKYTSAIKTLCDADIRQGRKLILETRFNECVKNEDYETAEGIKRALDEDGNKASVLPISGVSIFVCPYCKSERTKKLRTLYACLDCYGTFLANEC